MQRILRAYKILNISICTDNIPYRHMENMLVLSDYMNNQWVLDNKALSHFRYK